MTIGILASTQDRARRIIHTGPFLQDKDGADMVLLSPHSQHHRGLRLEAVFVDSDLLPLGKELTEQLALCLYAHRGGF